MPRTELKTLTAVTLVLAVVALWPAPVFADDFGDIVHRIEVRYHAHRNFRFLMAFAGFTARLWPGTGVRDVKIAYFENQDILQSEPDAELDELLQSVGKKGWQPLVKSYSRHHGSEEHAYIYAQPAGKELKLLIVNVEQREAEVIQVKVDPDKLEKFLAEHKHHHHEDVM